MADDLLHLIEIHGVGTMNSQKAMGVQPFFEMGQTDVNQKRAVGRVHRDVFALRFDSNDLLHPNRDDAVAPPATVNLSAPKGLTR